MENLQSRIKQTRLDKGLSQAELADMTGVSQPTVANWETGSHIPRPAVLERIGSVLDVSAAWLLSGGYADRFSPAQVYLKSPLKHLPVYNAVSPERDPRNFPVAEYVPFVILADTAFGIKTDSDDALRTQIEIFDGEETGDQKYGRLIAEITLYN